MIKLNFTQREKNIFVFCVLLILVFVIYRVVYLPLKENTDQLENRIYTAENNLKEALFTIEKSKIFEREYEDILKQFKQTVSDEAVMSSILSEIENVANQFDMRIVDMKPQAPKVIDFYKEFSVSLAIDGELARIIQFAHILQSAPHAFQINDMRLNKKSPKTSVLRTQLIFSRALFSLN